LCQADSDWEFCQWKHSSKEQEEARECLMEWKRAKGGVAVQSCDSSLAGRISISGDYSSHQCGLSISNIQLEDAGTWECEMEEYRFGDWVSGEKHSRSINISVAHMTTTIKPTTLTISTTTQQAATTTEEFKLQTTFETSEKSVVKADDYVVRDKVDSEDNHKEEAENHELKETEFEDGIEALPIEDKSNEEDSSTGLIAGLLVTVSIVIAAIVGGVVWSRKKKSVTIVSLQMDRDDNLAANAFLEEAEYHISIIKDPQD
jgi:hypothetical protein